MSGIEKLGLVFVFFSFWLLMVIPYRDVNGLGSKEASIISLVVFILGAVLFLVGRES